MFYYLSGELALRDINTCVIDCGGVGYKLTVSMLTSEALSSKVGEKVKLYTHLAVREDGVELFGFGNLAERSAFNQLTSVSGVGPKAAMSILSVMTPDKLALAVCTEDAKSISKAPNVGAKTAARIILELKDKLATEMLPSSEKNRGTSAGAISIPHAESSSISEATAALLVLGYDKSVILNAMKGLNPSLPAGEIIREVIKSISR